MKFMIYDLRFANRLPCAERGAEAAAVQTLARHLAACKLREAFGLRRVYRRLVPSSTTKGRNEDAL